MALMGRTFWVLGVLLGLLACASPSTVGPTGDAVTQVIEPFVSIKATPYTDALARPAISTGLQALMQLMQGENAGARDRLAWVSLCGGLALANAGLGAVHGLAGVIGGLTGAAHGAICGALLGPVLQANRDATTGAARARLDGPVPSEAGLRSAATGVLGVLARAVHPARRVSQGPPQRAVRAWEWVFS